MIADIKNAYLSTKIATFKFDLRDIDSIKSAANEVHSIADHIDVLINNAGVMSVQNRNLTLRGIENILTQNPEFP